MGLKEDTSLIKAHNRAADEKSTYELYDRYAYCEEKYMMNAAENSGLRNKSRSSQDPYWYPHEHAQ